MLGDYSLDNNSSWIDLGRRGAFTTAQVGRLVGATSDEVSTWVSGKTPIIVSGLPMVAGRIALTFDALVEARAVAYLLKEGITRRRLRLVMSELRRRLCETNPLSLQKTILTDGAVVFEEIDGTLVDLLNNAYVLDGIVQHGLSGRVKFISGRAAWLEPYPLDLPLVRIDPKRAFGRPIIAEAGTYTPIASLADAARLEGSLEAADWFGVTEEAVRQAVVFEQRIAA
jgi:uncharacterized protein (DUF433 family)